MGWMISMGFGIQTACRVLEAEEHELFSRDLGQLARAQQTPFAFDTPT